MVMCKGVLAGQRVLCSEIGWMDFLSYQNVYQCLLCTLSWVMTQPGPCPQGVRLAVGHELEVNTEEWALCVKAHVSWTLQQGDLYTPPSHIFPKGQLECWLGSPSVASSVALNACSLFLLLVEITFTPYHTDEAGAPPAFRGGSASGLTNHSSPAVWPQWLAPGRSCDPQWPNQGLPWYLLWSHEGSYNPICRAVKKKLKAWVVQTLHI